MRLPFKRGILFFVATVLLVSAPAVMQSATTNQFSDVIEENPFGNTILEMRQKGFVAGYPDGTFAPDNSISRAEFITMVVRATNPSPKGAGCFPDVASDWYAPFVCTAKQNGWVRGYDDGTFKPANNINFAEAATILNRAYGLNPGAASAGENWYKPFVKTLESKNAIPVSIDNPEKKISRAETTELNWRLSTNNTLKPTKTYDALLEPLPKIASCTELKERVSLLQYRQAKWDRYYGQFAEGGGGGAEGDSAMIPSMSKEESASDYSQTNVQVQGVDEADVIKNDGKYIYMVSRGQVKIISAYPPTSMQETIADFNFSDADFFPTELYVTTNKLIVLGSTYKTDSKEIYYSGSRTEAFVIDIKDKANPKEEHKLTFDGNMVSSRRINEKIFLVTSVPSYYLPLDASQQSIGKILPNYYDSKTAKTIPVVPCSEVRIVPNPESLNFLTVVGFDTENASAPISKAVVMGASGQTVYSSEDNLYVAHTKYTYPEVGIFDTMSAPDFSMPVWQSSQEKTEIYRFNLDGGNVSYKEKGEVPGNVLNQFAMDEDGNRFRLVTHTNAMWGPRGNIIKKATNNLYILNRDSLGTVLGKIENLAPGEDLHSVRFIGKRAYFVTFKQIDPFFVVDLTSSSSPKVLGELKIPGYSDYLHPYDENHIIGFGKEVDPTIDADKVSSDDVVYFTAVQGLKIALFDVTDPTNPTALFKEVIGDRGTDSELLYNHKALLFDKSRGILGFPVTVTEIKNKDERPDPWSTYGEIVFQGAYVYNLDLTNGFVLRGKLSNFDDISELNKDYWGWFENRNTIKRILYIGEYLYGVSPGRVKAVNRDGMQEVGKLDLNIPKEDYYGPVY